MGCVYSYRGKAFASKQALLDYLNNTVNNSSLNLDTNSLFKTTSESLEDTSTEYTDNIKPGVQELFESNPELANQVYSALGVNQFKFASLNKYSNLNESTLSKKEEAVAFLQSLDNKRLFSPSEMLSRISNAETSKINKGLSDYLNTILEQYQGIYTEESANPYRIEFKENLKLSNDDTGIEFGTLGGFNQAGKKFFNLDKIESRDVISLILHEFAHDIEPYVRKKDNSLHEKTKNLQTPLTEKQKELGSKLNELRKFTISYLAEDFKKNRVAKLEKDVIDYENGKILEPFGTPASRVYIDNLKREIEKTKKVIEDNEVKKYIEKSTNIFFYRSHYGLSNINEFIAESLTNEEFRKVLNEIPYKNTTVLSYLFELFQKILGIKKDTVLSEALNLIHELATTKREQIRNFEITPQQKQQALQVYSQYLDTIFPDSQVKDIVYHGTPDGRFDSFDINQAGKNTKQSTQGIYFTDSKKTADFYAEGSIDFTQFESLEEYNAVKTAKVFSAILNAKNLKLVSNPQAQDRQGDAILRTKEKLSDKGFVGELDYAYQYIVFEPEQIHILGNKQDIEGFKEFVGTQDTQFQAPVDDTTESIAESNYKFSESQGNFFLQEVGREYPLLKITKPNIKGNKLIVDDISSPSLYSIGLLTETDINPVTKNKRILQSQIYKARDPKEALKSINEFLKSKNVDVISYDFSEYIKDKLIYDNILNSFLKNKKLDTNLQDILRNRDLTKETSNYLENLITDIQNNLVQKLNVSKNLVEVIPFVDINYENNKLLLNININELQALFDISYKNKVSSNLGEEIITESIAEGTEQQYTEAEKNNDNNTERTVPNWASELYDNYLGVKNKKIEPPYTKIIRRVEAKIKNLQAQKKLPNANPFIINEKIEYFKENLSELKATTEELSTFKDIVYGLFNEELDEIQNALNTSSELTPIELADYIKTINVAKDIQELLNLPYSDPITEDIRNKAFNIDNALMKLITGNLLEQIQEKDATTVEQDLLYIEESPETFARNYGLDLSRAKNPLVQWTATTIQSAAIKRQINIQNKLKKLTEFRNTLSKDEIESIYQRDKDGNILRNSLVKVYSPQYYNTIYLKKFAVKNANSSEEKNKAVKDLIDFFKDNTTTIDPQIFLTTENNKTLRDSAIKTEIARINAFVGNLEAATDLVNKAERQYNYYKVEEQRYKEYLINSELQENSSEYKTALAEWQFQNSPQVRYTYYYGDPAFRDYLIEDFTNLGVDPDPSKFKSGSRFMTIVPKKFNSDGSLTGLIDSNYERIQNNSKLRNWYEFIKDTMKEGRNNLPEYAESDMKSNYIYRAKSDLTADLFTLLKRKDHGFSEVIKKYVNNTIKYLAKTYQEDVIKDAENNINIPVQVFKNIDDEITRLQHVLNTNKNLTEEERNDILKEIETLESNYTTDIFESMQMFITMTEHYSAMNQIKSTVNLAKELIDRANKLHGTTPVPGGLKSTKIALDYTIQAIMEGKPVDTEGVYKKGYKFKGDIYGIKDIIPFVGNTKAKKRAEEISKEIDTILEDRERIEYELQKGMDYEDLSDTDKEIYERYEKLEKEYLSLEGKRTTGSVIANSLLSAMNLKGIGWNPFSAVANLGFGIVSNLIEAHGGQEYGVSSYIKAVSMMMANVAKSLSLGTIQPGAAKKISAMLEDMDILGSLNDANYGKYYKKKTGIMGKLDPMAMMGSSDFLIKGQAVLALMLDTRSRLNKMIAEKEGLDKFSMYDFITDEGIFDTSSLSEETQQWWETEGKVLWRRYASDVITKSHGNFDPNRPYTFKKYAIGRLIGQFRFSWMLEGMESRFGEKYYNQTLGRDIEGRYRTIFKYITNNDGSALSNFKKLVTSAYLNKGEITELEKEAIRKAMMEMLIVTSFYLTAMLLKGMIDDDDEEKNKILRFAINSIQRVQDDTQFYVSPEVFTSFLSRPIPSYGLYVDFKKAITASRKALLDDEYDVDIAINKWMKALPLVNNVSRVEFYANKYLKDLQELR